MFESDVEDLTATDPLRDLWWDLSRLAPPDDLDDLDGFERQPWAERLSSEPGGVLAVAVEDAVVDGPVADLDDDAVVAAAVAAQRLIGWAMGAQLQAVAELGRRWELTPLGERAAVAELALACGVSQYALSQRMDAAMVLPCRLPRVWAALVAGRLEWAKAWEILNSTLVLSDRDATAVEGGALAVALSSNLPDLRAHLARAVLDVDPEGADLRAKDAHARRGVSFRPGPDATGVMTLAASAAAIAAAEAALNRLTAAALRDDDLPAAPTASSGDVHPARCPAVTRADVLLDLIHTADTGLPSTPAPQESTAANVHGQPTPSRQSPQGRPGQRTRPEIVLTLPLSTLLALTDHPGALAGYGPVPAAMARELAAEVATTATWRCAVTDDRPGYRHGTLLALGRSTHTLAYTPTAATRDFVTTRDGTCRFPGCRRRAGRAVADAADLDHRIPWRTDGSGGATCECNLQSLCRNHHRLKHVARFGATRDERGTLTWTTPTGRTYRQPLDPIPSAPLPIKHGPPDADPDPPPF